MIPELICLSLGRKYFMGEKVKESKRSKILVIRYISHRDVMYRTGNVVNNILKIPKFLNFHYVDYENNVETYIFS